MSVTELPWECPQDDTCSASRHDDWQGYRRGCKSGKARHSQHRYRKLRRLGIAPTRRVSSLGPRRRLRALVAIGWSYKALAEELGWHDSWTGDFARGSVSAEWCTSETAQHIAGVYDRLCMTPGGKTIETRSRSVNIAKRNGWAPPLAFDDIDDPAERPKWGVTRPGVARRDPEQLRADIARMTRAGQSAVEIAAEIGMHRRSVERIRSSLRGGEAGAA